MLSLYEVRKPGGDWLRLWAKNSRDAKRRYCKMFGLRPSDPWTGISYLTARRVKEERPCSEH